MGSEGSAEQMHEPMDKNRTRGVGVGRAGRVTRSPYPSKASGVNSGGGVRKAVELTSGGLHRVCCGSLGQTARVARRVSAVQKSAEGILAVSRLPRRNRAGAAAKARTE